MQLGSVGLSKVGSPTINASYEYSFYMMALRHGARVIVADLIGLGMPGHHTYVNHIEEAHALLDAARSGLELAHAPKDAPIGFAGYSQGGGASLSGGQGKAAGTLVGAILLAVIRNGLNLLNVSSFWQQIVIGLVIALAVGFDVIRNKTAS